MREYLKLVIREGSTLTAGEMAKRPGRFEAFLSMMQKGEAFQTDAGEVTISPKDNPDLVAALQAPHDQRPAAYAAAFAKGVTTSGGVLKSAGSIKKTKEFGGRGGSGSSAAGLNETVFADKVKSLAANGPITVVLGQKVIPGVTDAKQTGSAKVDGQTSKADVVLETSKGQVRLSIKMKTAEYYLSGDALLAPIVGPIVKDLLAKKGSVPRVQKDGSKYSLMYGDETASGISFPISPALAQSSVFGEGANTVDVVVKGDLTVDPDKKGNTYTWSDVKTYETVEALPEDDKPVGLLRTGEAGRGFTYKGEKYSGIRPAIVSKKRARNAYPVTGS